MSHPKRSLYVRRAIVAGLSGAVLMSGIPTFAFADTESDLVAAREQLEQIGRQTEEITGRLSELTYTLEETRGQIDKTNSEIAERQQLLSTFVSSEYKGGLAGLIEIVLSSTSFDQFISSVTYMNKVADTQAETISEVKTLKEGLNVKQAEQEKNVKETQAKVDELNAQRAEAASVVSSLDAKLQEELAAEAAANAALQQGLNASQGDQIDDVQNTEAPSTGTNTNTNNNSANNNTSNGNTSNGNANNNTNNGNTNNNTNTDTGANNNSGGNEPNYVPSTGNAIVDRAWSWVGKAEYVWGGCAPGKFDCSGFVSYCLTGQYRRLGTTNTFMGWPQVSNPQPGDVCVNWGHAGIYIGNGQMIHAATFGVGVIVGPVQPGMIYVRY